MENWKIFRILISELIGPVLTERVPEPHIIMDQKENALDFSQGGNINSPLGMSYLIYVLQICQSIKPGSKVVDLGCGPGTLLTLLASLMPDVEFVGVDLSEEMLNIAKINVQNLGLTNVSFLQEDMTNTPGIKDHSSDAVISTIAIHHLPKNEDLVHFFKNTKRILKIRGQMLILDYGRLKTNFAIEFFALKYKHRQSQLLTLDLLNSLKAAFSIKELECALKEAGIEGYGIKSTFIAPFMVTIERNADYQELNGTQIDFLKKSLSQLDKDLYMDFKKLMLFMKLGGHTLLLPK